MVTLDGWTKSSRSGGSLNTDCVEVKAVESVPAA
jgi:hypothetical protein